MWRNSGRQIPSGNLPSTADKLELIMNLRSFVAIPALLTPLLMSCASEPLWPSDGPDRVGAMAIVTYDSEYPHCDLVLRVDGTGGGARIQLGTGVGRVLVGAVPGTYILESLDCGAGIKVPLSEPTRPLKVTLSEDGISYLGAYRIQAKDPKNNRQRFILGTASKGPALRQLQSAAEKLGSRAERLVSGFSGAKMFPQLAKQGAVSGLETKFVYDAGTQNPKPNQKVSDLVNACYLTEQNSNPMLVGSFRVSVRFQAKGNPVFSDVKNDSSLRSDFLECLKQSLPTASETFTGTAYISLKPR